MTRGEIEYDDEGPWQVWTSMVDSALSKAPTKDKAE